MDLRTNASTGSFKLSKWPCGTKNTQNNLLIQWLAVRIVLIIPSVLQMYCCNALQNFLIVDYAKPLSKKRWKQEI